MKETKERAKPKHRRGTMPKSEFLKLDTATKKAEMVAWLMRRGKSLWEARQIVHRKFYHGDPFVIGNDIQ